MSFAFTPASFLGREVAECEVSRAIFRTKDFLESLSVQSEFAPRRSLRVSSIPDILFFVLARKAIRYSFAEIKPGVRAPSGSGVSF